LNIRFGAAPLTEVYMPQLPPHCPVLISRSSQWAKMVLFMLPAGRQTLLPDMLLPENCRSPLEEAIALPKDCP
jgi:hypothetical protein